MEVSIHPGAVWKYLGSKGKKEAHLLIIVDREHIITISDSLNYSWLGDLAEFLNEFAPL